MRVGLFLSRGGFCHGLCDFIALFFALGAHVEVWCHQLFIYVLVHGVSRGQHNNSLSMYTVYACHKRCQLNFFTAVLISPLIVFFLFFSTCWASSCFCCPLPHPPVLLSLPPIGELQHPLGRPFFCNLLECSSSYT